MPESQSPTPSPISSPIDDMPVPETLTARVVKPGSQPLLHGYDVQADLARHFDFGEMILLSLSGEAPSPEAGKKFNVLLAFAAPISVAEAPSHVAVLAQLCGSRPSGVAAIAATTLTEQARFTLDGLECLLGWLEAGDETAPPADCQPQSDEERAAVERLREAFRLKKLPLGRLGADLGLTSAIFAGAHDCQLTTRAQLEAMFCIARWPVAIAEAAAAPRGNLKEYPIRLPPFEPPQKGAAT